MQAWINGSLTAPAVPVKLSGMAKPYTPTQYRKAFTGRVKAARTVSGLSPLETAEKLGIPKDTYHRYETRTLLPHPPAAPPPGALLHAHGLRSRVADHRGPASA